MIIKKIAKIFLFRVMNYSINRSCKEQKLTEMKLKLAKIIPDLSDQYTQYPKYSPLTLFRFLWRKFDFDGFYGVILQKDNTVLKKYADW